jgi:hypothetical protein
MAKRIRLIPRRPRSKRSEFPPGYFLPVLLRRSIFGGADTMPEFLAMDFSDPPKKRTRTKVR